MWNYFEASGYLWHLALILKTRRSKSFGTPSEPRDGSLPPNSCLYKIQYTIHYNTVPYTVHAWHLSWQRCAHSRHYFDGIRWLHRIFVIIHFVVKQFISTMNTFLRFEVKLFVFKSIIIRYQHNKHHHVFILEYSPFLNPLEWLTRSCLWQRNHLSFICILKT